MTEIIIKETNKIKRIEVIDPKTGLDWSGNLIGNAAPEIEGYDDEGRMIMTEETFDWWETYCIAYENADKALYEYMQDRENDDLEKFADYISGIEFNDLPGAMRSFIEEN